MTRRLIAAILMIATVTLSAQDERRSAARLSEGFKEMAAGRIDQAKAIFDEVASLAIAAKDDRSLGEARRGQGRVAAARGDAASMSTAYREALALFESANDLLGMGQVHSDFGFAAWRSGDSKTARAEYEQAAAVFERAGLKLNQAGALRNMTFGDMPREEKVVTLERALVLAEEARSENTQGLILHALGDQYSGLGQQQASLERYERALPLLERSGDAADLARLLTSFGRLHRVHGDPSTALAYYERTIALLKGTTDRDGERQAEDALAVALMVLDRPHEALPHAERALQLARDVRPSLVPNQQLRVGELAIRINDFDRAIEMLSVPQPNPGAEVMRRAARSKALVRRGDVAAALADAEAAVAGAPAMNWEYKTASYYARSEAYEAAGRIAEAAADASAAVAVIEGVREGLVNNDTLRAAFSDGYRIFYDRAVMLHERLGKHDEAYRIAESGRSRALADLIGAKSDGVLADAGNAPIAKGDVLIAYWVTRAATFAWVVNDTGVVLAKRFDMTRANLETLVSDSQSMSREIANTNARRGQSAVFDKDPRPSLRKIYDSVFAPLRASLGTTNRLMIIPDGPLLGMSFAELLDRTGRYLVEDYIVQYAPSARLMAKREHAPAASPSALLVSLSSGYPKALGVSLSALPGATREVDAITSLFGTRGTTRVSDGDATEARIREALADRQVIHFATHAIASSEHPADSFLALRPGGGQDGRFTAAEILSTKISADLVVLSACRGAAGRVSGEGMLGLSRALLGAGAHNLLASVRELPDETAADVLPAFYRAWRANGDAAAALRTAQLARLKKLRAGQVRVSTPFGPMQMPEHPSLWSGLVLIGER